MTIRIQDIIKAIQNGKAHEVIKLKDYLDSIIEDYRKKTIIRVQILNVDGNICPQIRKKFPQFHCHWESGDCEAAIGTNHVSIPSQLWNDEVKTELSKFDSFVGHHIDYRIDYKLKKDVVINDSVLKSKLQEIADVRHLPLEEVTFSAYFLKNELRVWNLDQYFEEVKVISKEWDNQLWVYDERDYNDPIIKWLEDKVVEI